ncbi:MAG: hypothetical protein ACRCR1_07770 [Aeromonas sp.]
MTLLPYLLLRPEQIAEQAAPGSNTAPLLPASWPRHPVPQARLRNYLDL